MKMRDNQLKEDARSSFVSLFMDGRNEHGTHLLAMNNHSIPGDMLGNFFSEDLDPKGDIAEEVFSAAEKIGFTTSAIITAVFRYNKGDCENDGYYEFVKISEPLTMLFWGGAADQRNSARGVSR